MSVYAALLARPGARGLALACFSGWVSYGGLGLALVLVVQDATGSFAAAGAAVSAFSACAGAFAPLRGRLVDRHGGVPLVALAVAHAVCLLTLGGLAHDDDLMGRLGHVPTGLAGVDPGVALAIAAALAGASAPPLIATARALWPRIAGPDLTRTAHATNALLGDVGVLLGPALAAGLALALGPVAALALIALGPLAGAAVVASLNARAGANANASANPGAHPPLPSASASLGAHPARAPQPRARAARSLLRHNPALVTLMAGEVALGLAIGAVEVATPALAARGGTPESAAIALVALAAGSVAASLWAGRSTRAGTAGRRYAGGFALFALALACGPLTTSVHALAVPLALAGVGFGLLNVALFELLDAVAPADRAIEALTWLTSAEGLGLALGAAITGVLAARAPALALGFAALAGLLGAALAIGRRATLRGASA